MNASLSGGESLKPIVQLTDADMKDVSALTKRGFGGEHRLSDDVAMSALVSLQRGRGETKGERYKRLAQAVRACADSTDPRIAEAWKQANAPLVRAKMLNSAQVHNDATIANMSIQYANDEYIGLDLMPVVPMGKRSDIYYIYDKRGRLSAPDDEAGDDSDIAEHNETRSTATYSCKMRALQSRIGATVVANQDAPLNELMDLSEALFDVRALKREQRIATVVFTSTNYASGNTTSKNAVDRWDSAGGGNPIKDLQDADAALWSGAGPSSKVAVSSLAVYNVLSRHPDILALFQYNGSSPGLATPDMIARFFMWDRYLVGRARKDTANEAEAASYSRIWGDSFAVLRVAGRPSIRNASFGYTLRWTMPGVPGSNTGIVSQQWFDPTKGLGGSYFAKVGEAEDHKVVAGDTGYFIGTPIG